MATTDFIFNTLRTYMDEPDQTFADDAMVIRFLQIGYQEFRNAAIMFDPSPFLKTASYPIAGVDNIDLTTAVPTGFAGPILGATAAQGEQLDMMVTVYREPTNGSVPTLVFQQVQSLAAMQSTPSACIFSEGKLTFGCNQTSTVQVSYVPSSNVSWSAIGGFIDDLGLFHDLIALYAYKQYSIMDAASNPVLVDQTRKREEEFRNYMNTRSVGGANYVQDVTSAGFWL